MERKLLFSVAIEDCKVNTFTVKGPGGSGKDTSNTGVRITHPASGGTGVCVKHRSQHKNKIEAFKRMRQSKEFRLWHKLKVAELMSGETVEQAVEKAMQPANLKLEVRTSNGWELTHWRECDNNPCTCVDGPDTVRHRIQVGEKMGTDSPNGGTGTE